MYKKMDSNKLVKLGKDGNMHAWDINTISGTMGDNAGSVGQKRMMALLDDIVKRDLGCEWEIEPLFYRGIVHGEEVNIGVDGQWSLLIEGFPLCVVKSYWGRKEILDSIIDGMVKCYEDRELIRGTKLYDIVKDYWDAVGI